MRNDVALSQTQLSPCKCGSTSNKNILNKLFVCLRPSSINHATCHGEITFIDKNLNFTSAYKIPFHFINRNKYNYSILHTTQSFITNFKSKDCITLAVYLRSPRLTFLKCKPHTHTRTRTSLFFALIKSFKMLSSVHTALNINIVSCYFCVNIFNLSLMILKKFGVNKHIIFSQQSMLIKVIQVI